MSRRPAPIHPAAPAGPTFARRRDLPPLREIPAPAGLEASFRRNLALTGDPNCYLRTYGMGGCSVIVTRECGLFHLSIAHPRRMPEWDEIAAAWYGAVPGAANRRAGLILPPLHEYINMNEYCMQVHELGPEGQ